MFKALIRKNLEDVAEIYGEDCAKFIRKGLKAKLKKAEEELEAEMMKKAEGMGVCDE
jgi:hypothetical protein